MCIFKRYTDFIQFSLPPSRAPVMAELTMTPTVPVLFLYKNQLFCKKKICIISLQRLNYCQSCIVTHYCKEHFV